MLMNNQISDQKLETGLTQRNVKLSYNLRKRTEMACKYIQYMEYNMEFHNLNWMYLSL